MEKKKLGWPSLRRPVRSSKYLTLHVANRFSQLSGQINMWAGLAEPLHAAHVRKLFYLFYQTDGQKFSTTSDRKKTLRW